MGPWSHPILFTTVALLTSSNMTATVQMVALPVGIIFGRGRCVLIAPLGLFNYPGQSGSWEESKYNPATNAYDKKYTYKCATCHIAWKTT